MGLTKHQNEILNKVLHILSKQDRLLIEGSAGVGKTYLVDQLISELAINIPAKRKILCSAPTNKAVSVVQGKVQDRSNLEFITVHSALKIKRQVNRKTGEVTFAPSFSDKYPPLKGVSLFIIDEASMLTSSLLEFVEEHAKKQGAKVIFIGDRKQLNPVKEEISPVFEANYPRLELTEIIRQGEGNPIIELSRDLSMIAGKKEKRTESGGFIYTWDRDKVVQTLAKVNGTDALKYLAWTNKEVSTVNTLVRQAIYGENPAKIELEETLVFNEPYKEVYYTNKEVKVETLLVRERYFRFPFDKDGDNSMHKKDNKFPPEDIMVKLKYYSINYNKDGLTGEIADDIIVIHEDSEETWKTNLKAVEGRCKMRTVDWIDFFRCKEQVADLTYNHAITVHKSQGSTYEKAIVNIKNIERNRNKSEKQKLLYTAATRASELLILYNV